MFTLTHACMKIKKIHIFISVSVCSKGGPHGKKELTFPDARTDPVALCVLMRVTANREDKNKSQRCAMEMFVDVRIIFVSAC